MFENFPLFPQQASTVAGEVDAIYLTWVAISVVSSLLVLAAIFYFFARYRRRHPDQVGEKEHSSTQLEIIWSVIPLIICLAMFVWGTKVFFEVYRVPTDAVEYHATGKQWMWKFQHPSGKREINELHVPLGQRIQIQMISEDVIHDLYLPAFRVKKDVLPGRYTSLWFEATKLGSYRLYCAEYCGTEHSLMGGWVHVLEEADYEAWLAATPASAVRDGEDGEALFASLACNTCHMDGSRARGPLLDGVYGEPVELASGEQVIATDEYIRESILNPQAKVVAGWAPVMPTYQGQITEDQILQLIDYIKALPKETAAADAGAESSTPATVASGG